MSSSSSSNSRSRLAQQPVAGIVFAEHVVEQARRGLQHGARSCAGRDGSTASARRYARCRGSAGAPVRPALSCPGSASSERVDRARRGASSSGSSAPQSRSVAAEQLEAVVVDRQREGAGAGLAGAPGDEARRARDARCVRRRDRRRGASPRASSASRRAGFRASAAPTSAPAARASAARRCSSGLSKSPRAARAKARPWRRRAWSRAACGRRPSAGTVARRPWPPCGQRRSRRGCGRIRADGRRTRSGRPPSAGRRNFPRPMPSLAPRGAGPYCTMSAGVAGDRRRY